MKELCTDIELAYHVLEQMLIEKMGVYNSWMKLNDNIEFSFDIDDSYADNQSGIISGCSIKFSFQKYDQPFFGVWFYGAVYQEKFHIFYYKIRIKSQKEWKEYLITDDHKKAQDIFYEHKVSPLTLQNAIIKAMLEFI